MLEPHEFTDKVKALLYENLNAGSTELTRDEIYNIQIRFDKNFEGQRIYTIWGPIADKIPDSILAQIHNLWNS